MTKKDIVRQSPGSIERSSLRELLKKFLDEGEEDSFHWESLTTKNGLPHNWIYDLFIDSKNRIWISTWGGGIAVYDGKVSKTFTTKDGLLSNAVTCVQEDKKGKIWIATDKGLHVYENNELAISGLRGKSLLNICIDSQENIWAGCWRAAQTGGGLFRYNGNRWKSFSKRDGLPGLEILKVFEDSKGNIWVGTYEEGQGAGVGRFDGRSWKSYSVADGLIDNCVYSMFEDPEGSMWFGTTGGISILDKKGGWHNLTRSNGLADDRIYSMFIDSRNKMWFGTEGGVSRYDGSNWKSFTRTSGLVEDLVRSIIEDEEGNIWFGTYPYFPGRGGISIAKYVQPARKLIDKLEQYLPSVGSKVLPDPK